MCATRLWIMASFLWVLSGTPCPSSKPNPDQAATWRCCRGGAGLVVDVGANFGWYTLYSLALGCRTLSFEPVPMWREVLRIGVALNRGFGARVRVVPRVVSNRKGVVTLAVPRPEAADFEGKGKLLLGMTGMVGPAGLVKGYRLDGPQAVRVEANSTRLDDVLTGSDANVCMLKADVEGYEPQVLLTAKKMLQQRRVWAVQLELTRPRDPLQTRANIHMLSQLIANNFSIRQVATYRPAGGVVRDWRAHSDTTFASFSSFPLSGVSVAKAWGTQFGFSTNVLAVRETTVR